jgi:hypothetical protein
LTTKCGDHIDHEPIRAWSYHGAKRTQRRPSARQPKGMLIRVRLGRGEAMCLRDQSACSKCSKKKEKRKTTSRSCKSHNKRGECTDTPCAPRIHKKTRMRMGTANLGSSRRVLVVVVNVQHARAQDAIREVNGWAASRNTYTHTHTPQP